MPLGSCRVQRHIVIVCLQQSNSSKFKRSCQTVVKSPYWKYRYSNLKSVSLKVWVSKPCGLRFIIGCSLVSSSLSGTPFSDPSNPTVSKVSIFFAMVVVIFCHTSHSIDNGNYTHIYIYAIICDYMRIYVHFYTLYSIIFHYTIMIYNVQYTYTI